jgi:hypothetical protein
MTIKQIAQVMMTPEEQVIVQQKLKEIASRSRLSPFPCLNQEIDSQTKYFT